MVYYYKHIKFIKQENISYCVIGNGTNVLVTDKGFRGIIIKLKSLRNGQFRVG